jgi:hypothetical protein
MGVAMSRKVLIVAGAFIVLEVALGGLAWLDRYDIDDRDCPEAAKAKSNSKAKTIQLETVENQDLIMKVGRELGTKEEIISFRVKGTALSSQEQFAVEVEPFERSDGGQLHGKRTAAVARADRDLVRVVFCLSRPWTGSEDPGLYTGRLRFVDPRIAPTAVTARVELAHPAYGLVAAWALLACAAGVVWIWWLGHQSLLSAAAVGRDFETWLFLPSTLIAIGAGLAGATLAWIATYISNPTWGENIGQWAALFGACFTAFTTAATVPTVVAAGQNLPADNNEHDTRQKASS